MQAQRQALPGSRWHFQHGPIDLVIGAEGDPGALADCHRAAWQCFEHILPELVAELPLLRRPVAVEAGPQDCPLQGPVARRMWLACQPLRRHWITPMAAVAGSVAEELIACYRRPGVQRAWINNGGDIALFLVPGQRVRVGLFADLGRIGTALLGVETVDAGRRSPARNTTLRVTTDGQFEIDAESGIRGIATSGWRGRSFSLGIADSVTVLAATAAQADAAATLVANAVDCDHPGIVRRPANALKDDTDLGDRSVTVAVPDLPAGVVAAALAAGQRRADELREAGLIGACALVCQGQWRFSGPADQVTRPVMTAPDRPVAALQPATDSALPAHP